MKLATTSLLCICVASTAIGQDAPVPAPAEKAAGRPHIVMKTSLGEIEIELFADEAPKTVVNFIGLAEGEKEFTDPKTGEKTRRRYYDGLIFHRIIDGFMVQGGCPLGTGTGSPGFTFEDEINAKSLGLHEVKAMNDGQPHRNLLIRTQADFQRTVMGPLFRKLDIKSQEELDTRKDEVEAALEKLSLADVYAGLGYRYGEDRRSHAPKRGTLAMANSGPNTNGSQFFINLVDNDYLSGKHTVFGQVVRGMEVVDAMGRVKTDPASSRPLEDVTIESIRVVPAPKDGEDK